MRRETYETRLMVTLRAKVCVQCDIRYPIGTTMVYAPAEQGSLDMDRFFCPSCAICTCGISLTKVNRRMKASLQPQCYQCYYGGWAKEDAAKEF